MYLVFWGPRSFQFDLEMNINIYCMHYIIKEDYWRPQRAASYYLFFSKKADIHTYKQTNTHTNKQVRAENSPNKVSHSKQRPKVKHFLGIMYEWGLKSSRPVQVPFLKSALLTNQGRLSRRIFYNTLTSDSMNLMSLHISRVNHICQRRYLSGNKRAQYPCNGFSRDTDFSRDIFSLADGLKEVSK